MGPVQLREKIFETLLKRDLAEAIEVVQIEFELHELFGQMVSLTGLPQAAIESALLRQYPDWLRAKYGEEGDHPLEGEL